MAKRSLYFKFALVVLITTAFLFVYSNLTFGVLIKKTMGQFLISTSELKRMKYILQWTDSHTSPFRYMGIGQNTFIKKHCPVNNCFVTANRGYLKSVEDFDVVLFHGPELYREKKIILPAVRSPSQKYVFVSMESSDYYPICHNRFNGYFNWTWTYKLNSDMYYGYIIIRNNRSEIIGPRQEMHWISINDMEEVDEKIKAKLRTKHTAAAWFVSNCKTPNKREKVVKQMQQELAKFNMSLDIYGGCGTKKCPSDNMNDCLRMIERDYYFYISFENSFSEDYVTEKLLHALQHFTVPVVYGDANYTRFMPDGIYLDARRLGTKQLVNKMVELIKDKQKYYNFFKWQKYYSYHRAEEVPETDYYCKFCSKINDIKSMSETSIYYDFRRWWNPSKHRPRVC